MDTFIFKSMHIKKKNEEEYQQIAFWISKKEKAIEWYAKGNSVWMYKAPCRYLL